MAIESIQDLFEFNNNLLRNADLRSKFSGPEREFLDNVANNCRRLDDDPTLPFVNGDFESFEADGEFESFDFSDFFEPSSGFEK